MSVPHALKFKKFGLLGFRSVLKKSGKVSSFKLTLNDVNNESSKGICKLAHKSVGIEYIQICPDSMEQKTMQMLGLQYERLYFVCVIYLINFCFVHSALFVFYLLFQ